MAFMRRVMRRLFVFSVSGAAVLGAHPALAQGVASSAETPVADTIEEVVVTARRKEENLQVVPISVTAVSGEALIKKGVQNAYDLQYSVPSLNMNTSGTMSKALNPGIRSVSTRSFLLLDDPSVGTYFAETVIGHPWGFGDNMYDIQSVQVLKGPQGTLFGRNTTGGAMLIEPNKPSFEDGFSGSVKMSIGDYNLRQLDGVINMPFNDVAALRIATQFKTRDGYTTNILSGQKRDGVGKDAARIQLLLKPTRDVTSNTLIDYIKEDASPSGAKVINVYGPNGGFGLFGPTNPANNAFLGLSRIIKEGRSRDPWDIAQMGGTNIALPVTDPLYAFTAQDQHSPLKCDPNSPFFVPNHICRKDMIPKETLENWIFLNNTSIDFDGFTVKNIFSYRDTDHNNQDSATFPFGSPLLYSGQASMGDVQASIAGGGQADQHNKQSQVTNEFQIQGKSFDDRLSWATGLFYMREWGSESSPSYTNGATWSITQGNGRNISKGLFAQGTYALTNKLNLTLGVRKNWDERTAEDTATQQFGLTARCQTFNYDANGVEVRDVYPNCSLKGKQKWSANTYTLAADYQITDGTMVYGVRSRGYKSGGFSLRSRRPSIFQYDPEYMINTEVGVKSDWSLFDRPIRTNLSVFRMDYTKQQLQSTVPDTNPVITFVDNIGESRITGYEFEFAFKPVRSLELSGFVSYNNSKYKKYENNIGVVGGVDYGTVDLSGRPVGFYSKYKGGLSASWTLPLDTSNGEVVLRADAAFQSKWLTDQSQAGKVGLPASFDAIPGIAGFTMVPQAGYGVLNLRADWTRAMGGPLDLGLFITNVTNKEVLLGGSGVNGMVSTSIGPPRMFGFEVSYKFGEGFRPRD